MSVLFVFRFMMTLAKTDENPARKSQPQDSSIRPNPISNIKKRLEAGLEKDEAGDPHRFGLVVLGACISSISVLLLQVRRVEVLGSKHCTNLSKDDGTERTIHQELCMYTEYSVPR